jgi:hypothetical protein
MAPSSPVTTDRMKMPSSEERVFDPRLIFRLVTRTTLRPRRSYGVSFRFVNHIAIAIKTIPAASDSRSLGVLIFVSRAYSK